MKTRRKRYVDSGGGGVEALASILAVIVDCRVEAVIIRDAIAIGDTRGGDGHGGRNWCGSERGNIGKGGGVGERGEIVVVALVVRA